LLRIEVEIEIPKIRPLRKGTQTERCERSVKLVREWRDTQTHQNPMKLQRPSALEMSFGSDDVDLLEEHGDGSAVDRLEAHQVRLGLGLFDGPVQQAGGENKKRAGE
jgi:hypothetical protein